MSGSKNHLLDVLESTVSSSTAPDEKVLPYSNAMYRLREIHGSRDYMLLQRQKLRSMTQSPDEPDVKFVKRVAAVAKLCDYSSEQMMETVADVVQSHTLNIKVREAGRKVMRKGGSITELLDKVRSAEIERQSKEIYAKNHQLRKLLLLHTQPVILSTAMVTDQIFRVKVVFSDHAEDFSHVPGAHTSTRLEKATENAYRAGDVPVTSIDRRTVTQSIKSVGIAK
ncbi:uncharacterized protein LOC131677958 [Topomyia yanbarensis]|uniref:uncharacterized protein LOC131677958 n=1 Tax=Topomyia yanbarensis TaxID=2498891 RepID=UPI00273CE88B|nr:uncharacterized protein LOC131677958 [Topomyia yanbarensis]XP_058814045.1 uncharacterized protein LOC131677958 [Topomyia yanbarensis]